MSFVKKTVMVPLTKATQSGKFTKAFDLAGFKRDKGGVYYAKQDALQKYFGYNNLYDMAFDLGTSMDNKKISFASGGEKFVIWLWKGDYLNLGGGAEMGIYYGGGPHWKTGTKYAMPMTLAVKVIRFLVGILQKTIGGALDLILIIKI